MPKPRVIVRTLTAAAPVDLPPAGRALWEGTALVEGEPTGDGRLFEPSSLRWEDLPVPFSWAEKNLPEHFESVVVGRVLTLERDGSLIRATGDISWSSPDDAGYRYAKLVLGDEEGAISNGVSADLDDVDIEIRVAKEVLDELDAELEAIFSDDEPPEPEDREVDEDGRVVVYEFASDDEMMVFTDARVRGLTGVSMPAFAAARIEITDVEPASQEEAVDEAEELVASAPTRPAMSWFEDPKFGARPEVDPRLVRGEDGSVGCPLTVTDDGQVFGHLALWRTCHTGFSECVNPPASGTSYQYFHTGSLVTSENTEIPVGRLTLDTMHAGRKLSAVDTLAHYENTGVAVADVRAGEDAHGIWIAGAVRPGVSDETLRTLRASPPSGDWRRIGGNLELVAALAVNSPGFPVPRAMVASAGPTLQVQTLQSPALAFDDEPELTSDDMDMLRRMAERERKAERRRQAEALAEKMQTLRS